MLEAAGFVLARKNRHLVYKRGSDTITIARTPRSDNQAAWVRQEIARRDRAKAA